MTLVKLLLLAVAVSVASAQDSPKFRVYYQWKEIDFVWPSDEARTRADDRKEYIRENNAIAGIKIWKDKMFLTLPRWKSGVPVTLAVTSTNKTVVGHSPKLEAYPNWDMQTIGDCRAFQFVQSMEIDPKGRMWVLDSGRTETMTTEMKARCPPRLVILDLENEGAVLRSYEFPANVTSPDSAYLNDIVLDHEDGGYAYITDNSKTDPGIIVFSLEERDSWKVRDPVTMMADSENARFKVAGETIFDPIHVDGIALSPARDARRYVFYCPLSSFKLYSMPTWVLKNRTIDARSYIRELGRKESQTDGMMMSSYGVLFYGLLADDAISTWQMERSFPTGQRQISRDHLQLQWPDTFAFDNNPNNNSALFVVTNKLQNFINGRVNLSDYNYRVIKLNTPFVKSYQYYMNSSAPELPVIEAGADRVVIALSTCLAVVLAFIMK